MNLRFVPVIAAGLGLAAPSALPAQIRASERGSASQTVDGTTITIDYSRPQVRGRGDTLFGGLVPWGKVWTPGANWATTLETTKDITVNGRPLPAGKYSVWLQVQRDAWTAILDPEPKRFHLLPPPQSDGQVRFAVTPTTDEHVEVLSWWFPDVRPTGATLRFAWGTTALTFEIAVPPSRPVTMAREQADRFVGTYRMETRGLLGQGTATFEIGYDGVHLTARWPTAPNPHLRFIWLAPLGQGMFFPVEVEDGRLFDVVTDLVFEFTPLDARATRFEMRGIRDELWATGMRTN